MPATSDEINNDNSDKASTMSDECSERDEDGTNSESSPRDNLSSEELCLILVTVTKLTARTVVSQTQRYKPNKAAGKQGIQLDQVPVTQSY